MSVQIFLQGKILGIEQFLLASSSDMDGRSHWVSLLSEVLPRALLAELGLSKMLLGSSGGEQFLAVLPIEFRGDAEKFLVAAAAHIDLLSGGALKLIWASTGESGRLERGPQAPERGYAEQTGGSDAGRHRNISILL